MTVKAEITSTLNGQSADLILIEDSPDGARQYETKSLSGGSENLVFTGLDGGSDKEYTAKIVPNTSDVTQTSEVNFGATVDIDPIPHRDADASNQVRETAEFNNGVGAKELQLGDHPLIGGLLTTALKNGEVLADDGYVYSSVQAAQDAASSWIFIGPGTFNEAVTIDTAGLTVQGSGYNTLIDGSSAKAISVDVGSVTIRNLSGRTNTSDGDTVIEGTTNSNDMAVINCVAREGNYRGFDLEGDDSLVSECTAESGIDNHGIRVTGLRTIVSNNSILSTGFRGIRVIGDDQIITNNIVNNTADRGMQVSPNDVLIGGNRINGAGSDGIRLFNTNDVIVYNNRISDSAGSNISDGGTGTLLDGNNTGAAN